MKSHKAIFISHAWGGISDEILAELTKTLEKEDISFILDKRDLGYRASINEFMVELGKADMVIIILSNKYLKSEYCMFELIQIYRNQNLRDRIFPIVLDEVKISSSADRLEFVKFWEDQLQNLQAKVKELDSLSYIEGITEDLNLYAEIRNNIARLTGILRDINTLNVTIHVESDYRDLIQSIKRKISNEPEKEENKIYITSTKPDSPVFNTFNYKLAGGSLLTLLAIFVTWKILSGPKDLAYEDGLYQRYPDSSQYYNMDNDNNTTSNQTTSANNQTSTPNNQVTGYTDEDIMITLDTSRILKMLLNNLENQNMLSQQAIDELYADDPQLNPKQSSTKEIKEPARSPTTFSKKQTPVEEKPTEKYTSHEPVKPPVVIKEQPKQTIPEETHEVIIHTNNPDLPKTSKTLKSYIVPKGTSLLVRNTTTISSDDGLPVPRKVNFTLEQPVYDGSTIAIPAGSSIVATILSVKMSESKRPGSINLAFNHLIAPDGQKIPLQKDEMYLVANGKNPFEIYANEKIKTKTSVSFQIKY